ncbi:MAG: hypothetical protein K2I79_04060 [Clostridia bacterium]|nr:hypothetical protein [Clostridia bacterium]
MSFCNNCKSDRIPCALRGNALNGLCEKACLQVDKVFDACIRQEQLDNQVLTLTNINPASLTTPYTFISAQSIGAAAQVTDLTITPLADNPGCARVTCNIVIPVSVAFVDANGVRGTADSSITVSRDVVLRVPAPSLIPYSVQATASVVSNIGTYNSENNTFTVVACVTVILKIVMPVHLLVPTYGYCYIPPCQEFNQQECAGVFDLPLYPQDGQL